MIDRTTFQSTPREDRNFPIYSFPIIARDDDDDGTLDSRVNRETASRWTDRTVCNSFKSHRIVLMDILLERYRCASERHQSATISVARERRQDRQAREL